MMLRLLSPLQAVLFALAPEQAHALTLRALQIIPSKKYVSDDPRLQSELLGLNFPNPVGMAAGFDKNAVVVCPLHALGFGFVEVGGVTPRPQSGNPQPRVFRLIRDGALINRLGFNNDGVEAVRARLEKIRSKPGIVGANLGANKDSEDKIADYLELMAKLGGFVDFVTLNISSPNTPGLRALQGKEVLHELLARVMEKRETVMARREVRLPLLLKIAPDLTLHDLDDIARLSLQHGVDGLIVSNTTISRPHLRSNKAKESGGLSGRPLFELSTRRLAQMRQRMGKEMVLIGVGGIDSGEAAWAKICAGANLIQLYTGLIYKGLPLLDEIKATLLMKMKEGRFISLQAAVGSQTSQYTDSIV
jgi:dihydroorotate dehydrogenase